MRTKMAVHGLLLLLVVGCVPAFAAQNPFIGNWALTIPDGGAGWLGIHEAAGELEGSILWGGGSVLPVHSVSVEGDALKVVRLHVSESKRKSGKVVKRTTTEIITAKVEGEALNLRQVKISPSGREGRPKAFTGKRIPPVPAAPDLAALKYGDAVQLLKADSLEGWELTNPKQKNAWRVANGVLINDIPEGEHKLNVSYGNLRTVETFEDFKLTLDVNVVKGGNSGIYLRGIYEVQVQDNFGKAPTAHSMGAIYSRIKPQASAEKPAGEWQSMEIILADRHVTVKLNDVMLIDNAPLLGCTGGALTSDEFKAGPLYLQGDHTAVKYRNIVLQPILK